MKLKSFCLSEKQIQDQILSFLRSKQVFSWQNKSTGTYDPTLKRFRKPGMWFKRGVSDILGIFNGRFLAIEVKSSKGKLSSEQVRFLEDVNKENGIGFVARSIEDVREELKL